MMSDAVFASALGCLGGVATRKAGVQCTAWRGTAGESWGSGRSARADMAGGHSEHANDAALDQVASATASALGAIKQQAMSSAATLVETMRAEPWQSLLSGAGGIASGTCSTSSTEAELKEELEEALVQAVAELGVAKALLWVLCWARAG